MLRVQMVAAPAPQGIDNVVYGAAPSYAVSAYAAPAYAAPAGQSYYATAAPTAPGYSAARYGAAAAPLYDTTASGVSVATSNPAATRAAAAYATTIPPYDTAAAPAYRATAAAPLYNTAAMPMSAPQIYGAAPAPSSNAMPAPVVSAAPVSYRPAVAAYPYGATYGYGATPQWAYTLDTGDRLRIVVFGQDGLTNSYLVDASGDIAMPLIGSVAVRGLTTDQLSRRIADLLRQGYVREPHVAVEIESYRPFFILGEVTQPGQYPYVANMTVETAVAIAGGFGPRAERKTVIVSRNYGGQVVRFRTPIAAQVQPGDTIQVQERWF